METASSEENSCAYATGLAHTASAQWNIQQVANVLGLQCLSRTVL